VDAAVTDERIHQLTRALKMPAVAREYTGLARRGLADQWTYEEFLSEVLATEVGSREASSIRQRIRDARFPEEKRIADFDYGVADGIDVKLIQSLAKGTWVGERKNIILAGPIGTGKTHLAIGLAYEVARLRRRVLFFRTADIVERLIEAKNQRELGRLRKRLSAVDLLVLDELGFVPFDREGGELLFNLIAERHERASTLITTNLAFSEWPRVFGGDEKLATAAIDRLAHHSVIITTRGRSYRTRHRAQPTSATEPALLAEDSPEAPSKGKTSPRHSK